MTTQEVKREAANPSEGSLSARKAAEEAPASSSVGDKPELQYRHLFGLKQDVKNNVHYLEDNQTVLYPVGHVIVVYSLESKTQRFIACSDPGDSGNCEIVALAVSPDKRYLAVSERNDNRAQVVIYDLRTLKRRKVLSTPDCQSNAFIALAFSPDSTHLLTLGGHPDWRLINWFFLQAKVEQMIRVPVEGKANAQRHHQTFQCSFCPTDQQLVCVTGKGTLKYFKWEPGNPQFKLLETSMFAERERDNTEDYLCHVWTTDKKMIVGTDTGSLLLLQNTMFRTVLKSSPKNGKAIDCIVAYNDLKAFVIAGEDGVLRTYEYDEKDQYTLNREFPPLDAQGSRIRNIAVSPMDDDVAVTTDTSQIFTLKSFATEMLKLSDMRFEPLTGALFHSGAITGLDTCARKPIVATCGADKTIRIWNFATKQLEQCVSFTETPICVALHPSGLHLLVGFQDKLRFMNVLMDDIRVVREFPLKCAEVQFSNGGHYFAAAHAGQIYVYHTYTCEQIPGSPMKGHATSNNTITSLFWSQDDTSIVSTGTDGAVYERKLNETMRRQDYVQKGYKFTCAVRSEEGMIYAVGDETREEQKKELRGCIKEIVDMSVNQNFNQGVVLTQLAITHAPQRMLFAGCAHGCVRVLPFPIPHVDERGNSYVCHANKPVNKIRVDVDDGFLFTVADDGTLAVFTIKEKEGRIPKRERPDAVPYSEEVLVTKSDLEDKTNAINELKAKVEELKSQNDYQLRVKDVQYNEKIKEAIERFNLELDHDRNKTDLLHDEKVELEVEFEDKIAHLKKMYDDALHAEDQKNQNLHMQELVKYQKLQQEMDEDARGHDRHMWELEAHHQQELQKLKDEFEDQLRLERAECQTVISEKDLIDREFKETVSQLEEDTDLEIEQLRQKYEIKLRNERDATLRLKGENGIMHKKFKALTKDIMDLKDNITAMQKKNEQLRDHHKQLEEKAKLHKAMIDERNKILEEKERQIYDLKKNNQELEKFKFVLDFQIKELKNQIDPRERDIEKKKEQVAKMDAELEELHKENGMKASDVENLKEGLKEKHVSIQRQRQLYRKAVGELTALANDVYLLVQHIQNPENLKANFDALYSRHVRETIQAAELDPDIQKEYKRQKLYLERSVDVLKNKLARDMKARKNDNMRVMQENVALIKEINKMRREIKLMHQVQRQKELSTATRPPQRMTLVDSDWDEREATKTLALQKEQIAQLRLAIEQAQAKVMRNRPISKERLAPVDEFAVQTLSKASS